ncbi:7727_t:CDS:2, partial [Paraglomus occultum]
MEKIQKDISQTLSSGFSEKEALVFGRSYLIPASSKPIRLEQQTRTELIALLEKNEKLLNDKELCSKLKDGGEKLRTTNARIRERLQKIDTVTRSSIDESSMRKKDNGFTEEFSNDLESQFRKLSLNSNMSGIGKGPRYYNVVKTRLLSVDEAAAIEEKQFKAARLHRVNEKRVSAVSYKVDFDGFRDRADDDSLESDYLGEAFSLLQGKTLLTIFKQSSAFFGEIFCCK